ncbi:2,5-diamino-6-ribosylamino-4(3H)-pyrimidinone 5'-phosphate reductase [Corynebacterium ciconiae DSM 44920]|nr:2,5-diamino-6-ribosylamino-4(3H)-pyrimidinone 5'-phosphate reductase [Corynebacterium ciconiae DSM 44920]
MGLMSPTPLSRSQILGTELPLSHREVRGVAISSLNGAATVEGTSGSLGNDNDTRVLTTLRAWADCVLVGAGTVRAENYGGVRLSPEQRADRLAAGQADTPPLAVITGSADMDTTSRFFTEVSASPIIITGSKNADRVATYEAAGAEVLLLDELSVDTALTALAERGYHRISIEGGPSIYGHALDHGLIDYLHLSIAPVITQIDRPLFSHPAHSTQLELDGVHHDEDGFLFTRYRLPRP